MEKTTAEETEAVTQITEAAGRIDMRALVVISTLCPVLVDG